MAEREIYRLDINIGVKGDNKAKKKLTATEKFVKQTEKRTKALNKIKVSPSVRLNDKLSKPADKIKSKMTKIDKIKANPSARLKDKASKPIDKVKTKMHKMDKTKATPIVKLKDKVSKPLKRVKAKISNFSKVAVKKFAAVATAGAVMIGGIGLGSTMKTYMNFEQGMKNVQATSQATDTQMIKLTNTAKKLGRTTAWSAKETSDGMNYLAMAGFKTNEITKAMPGLLDLASASGSGLAVTSDIVSDAITAFGLKAKDTTHLADVMAKASSTANTNVELLGESFRYASAPATAFGMSAEETTAALAMMANAGIKGSMSGAALRGALTRLSKPPKMAAKWLDKLGVSIADSHGKIKSFNSIMGDMRKKMSRLTQQEKQQAIASIFGQEAMSGMLAIVNTSTEDFDKYTKSLENADGAAKKMANTKLDSLNGQFTILKSAVEGMKIELGERLAPYAKKFVKWFTGKIPAITDKIVGIVEKISELAQKFSKLNPSTKKFIATLAIGSVAIGPLVKKISGLVKMGSKVKSFFGLFSGAKKATDAMKALGIAANVAKGATGGGGILGLAPALGKVAAVAPWVAAGVAAVGGAIYLAHKNTQYLSDSCVKSSEDMGVMETAMAGLNGHIIHTNKELEKMNVKYKKWNSKVSPETQKSLEQCANKIAEYSLELKRAEKIDNLVDGEDGQRLRAKLDKICDGAIQKIKSRQPEIQKTLAQSFKSDGLDSDEKKILESLNKSGNEQIKEVQTTKNKILELEKKASKETGDAKRRTLEQVNKLTQQIGTIEMKNTVKSKEELMAAQAEFNARMKNLDMQGMSKLLQEKAKARDSSNKKITQYYDKQIELLKLNMGNVDSETEKLYRKEIGKLETSKNTAITKENEKYQGFLNAAIEKNGQIINYVDMHNGQILSKQEQQKQLELNSYLTKMNGMVDITQSGYYQIKDSVSGEMHNCYVEVDSASGQIVGAWDSSTNQIYGNPIKAKEAINQDLKNGAAFQPIVTSYKSKKQEVWEDAVEVQSKESYGLFDWIKQARNGIQSWLDKHPFISKVVKVGSKLKHMVGYASGTNNATSGVHEVAEHGYEVVFGRQFRTFNGGEKVLNHRKSKKFLSGLTENEKVRDTPKPKFTVAKPQIAVAGGGNTVSVNVDVNNQFNNESDVDGIVAEAAKQFAYKLKQSLKNIK